MRPVDFELWVNVLSGNVQDLEPLVAIIEHIMLLTGQAAADGMYHHAGVGPVSPKAYAGKVGPGTYVDNNGKVSLTSEPARLLEQLYAATGPDDRKEFGPTLIKALNPVNARVIARTLAATGNVEFSKDVKAVDSVTEEFWQGMIHVLRFESHLFDEADLSALEEAVKPFMATAFQAALAKSKEKERSGYGGSYVPTQDPSGKMTYTLYIPQHTIRDELTSVIARVRYLRLAKTIRENQNPAIDADRQVLLSRLESLGFSDKLVNASNEVEQRAVTAATDLDVKTVMDLLRTFYEEFIEEACRKVEGKVGKDAPSGPKVNHFAPYRQYLENEGFIGVEESELLQKLYNFLSNQGTHKLGSAPEQLRVAHATVIEWCMLIAGRIQKFMS